MSAKLFQNKLLRWYDKNHRKLPWRLKKPNAYKTWVSEMMLQQTRVDTVLPYYRNFLKIFPTVQALAKANVEEVLKLWSGLGYYSRARNFHKAAQMIVNNYGGKFPSTQEELKKFPGIGDYSSAAISSIAFGEAVPVLDGNVHRVLTRLFTLSGDPKKKPLKDELRKRGQSLISVQRPGDFNQAMMELGALVCTPKAPQCLLCPLSSQCKAYKMGTVPLFPNPANRTTMKKVYWEASLIEKEGKFLIAMRNGKRHLQSMWEFPQIKPSGLKLKKEKTLSVVKHSIMNQNISLTPQMYQYQSGSPKKNKMYVDYEWIHPNELENYPSSSINQKIRRVLSTSLLGFLCLIASACGSSSSDCTETATYLATFDATWSTATHTDVPSGAHFSGLIGTTHNSELTIWATGSAASDGIKAMAEAGAKSPLTEEIAVAISAGTAGEEISGDGIATSPGSASDTFSITNDFSLVSLVSMIAPSPDWFVGVAGVDLCVDGEWLSTKTVSLLPYDAGTDSGATFTSDNLASEPQGVISALSEDPFLVDGVVASLGTFTFTKQ